MEGKNGMKLIFDLYPNSSFFYLQGLFPFTCYPCDLWSHRLRQLNFELSLHKTFKWSIEIKFLSRPLSLLIKARHLRATFYSCYPEFSVSTVQASWKAKCGHQCQGITLPDRWKRRFNDVCGYVTRELQNIILMDITTSYIW